MPVPSRWTGLFFYPILPCSCPICGVPTASGEPCELCRYKRLADQIHSANFLSYTWGRSRSPAYAFKKRDDFDEELREEIAHLFGWMAYSKYRYLADDAYVIGAPPRTTVRWGKQDHLNDLLLAVEEVNSRVLRNVLAFEREQVVVAHSEAAAVLRYAPVILVDNLLNTRKTALKVAALLRELGVRELHLCIMGRWLEGSTGDIRAATEYRDSVCPNRGQIDVWYRTSFEAR